MQRQTFRISDVRRAQRFNGFSFPIIFNYVTRPAAWPVTVLLARLGFGPNGATLVRIAVTISAFWALLSATPTLFWLGCGLFYLSLVLDHVDGQLSRLQNRASFFGKYFDGLIDSLTEIPFPMILGVHLWQQGAAPVILVISASAALAMALIQILFLRGGLVRKELGLLAAAGKSVEPAGHPVLVQRLGKWSRTRHLIDDIMPNVAWDVRYGAFAVALVFDGIEIYLIAMAAWHLLQLVLLLPSRIFQMYADTDIHRRSGTAV